MSADRSNNQSSSSSTRRTMRAAVLALASSSSSCVVHALPKPTTNTPLMDHQQQQQRWKIPPFAPKPYTRRHNAFLEECESLATFLAQLPARGGGGGDDYYGSSNSNYGRGSSSADRYYDDRGYDYDRQRRDDEDDYYDYGDNDRGTSRSNNAAAPAGAFLASLPSVFTTGNRQIGLSLLGSGTVITMLGMSLFFNKSLMRLGNLLVVAGVPITLGPTRTAGYFLQPQKVRATGCLAVGVLLVFLGMPVFGIALEVFGILNLFGNMFPVLLAVAKQMPVIGPILSGNNNNRRGDNNNNRQRRDDRDDDYYYNDGSGDRQGGGGGYGDDDGYY